MRKTALRASGVASFLVFVPLVTGAAQDKSPQPLRTENAFVIRADPRQPAVGAPLTLTFNDYFMQGKKRMVRSTTVTIPASDVRGSSMLLPIRAKPAGNRPAATPRQAP